MDMDMEHGHGHGWTWAWGRCEHAHARKHLRREAHPRGEVLGAAQPRDG